MDGGIVDNQGIGPLLLADRRMNRSKPESEVNQHSFDLLILADVASPFMEGFVSSQPLPDKGLWTWSPLQLLTANTVILLVSMAGVCLSIRQESILLAVLSSVFLTLSLIIFLTSRFLLSLPEKFEVPVSLMKPIGKLLSIKLGTYSALIMNRVRSLIKLSGEVFLKHVRRLNYATLYDDPSWENRRIMSAIYEAANVPEHIKRVRPNRKEFGKMTPSDAVRRTADTAWSMGTTLWFTEEELKKKNMLSCLIATGLFTLCWNLLEYITRLKKDNSNSTPAHDERLKLEGMIAEHWGQFQFRHCPTIMPR